MDYYYDEQCQGSLAGGILGALIGAIVGAIPWAIALYFGWMIGYFAFLISFGSFWGYILLKGQRNPITIWLSIIISTLAVIIFMNYASFVLSAMVELETKDLGFALVVVKEYLKENPRALMADSIMSLLFGGIGIYSARKHINTYL